MERKTHIFVCVCVETVTLYRVSVCLSRLVVIGFSVFDHIRAVQLLFEDDSCHLVGEGECREGEF